MPAVMLEPYLSGLSPWPPKPAPSGGLASTPAVAGEGERHVARMNTQTDAQETAPTMAPTRAQAAKPPEIRAIGRGDALLLVDVQCDFLPGGRLPVAGGDRILGPSRRLLQYFVDWGLPVYASRDWHPPDHCSFSPRGGPWPVHCVAGTDGAEFAPGLELPNPAVVISKACDGNKDAYSAFDGTGLADLLRAEGVRRLFVAGLATDYCVLRSVLDALAQGWSVVLLADAVAAVDLRAGDGTRALSRMRRHGAQLADSDQVLV